MNVSEGKLRLVIFGASNIVSDLFDCALANHLVPAKVVIDLPEDSSERSIPVAVRAARLAPMCPPPVSWYAPDHLTTLLDAIAGRDWAFSLRYFVDAPTGEMLCPDTWESVGPGRSVYANSQGGFVDTNCFLIDKLACHDVFPERAMTRYAGGAGGDRQILQRLLQRPYGTNGAHTLYYRQNLIGHHPYLLWRLRCAGVDLGRFMPSTAIPSEGVWQECAEIDRRLGANSPSAEGVR